MIWNNLTGGYARIATDDCKIMKHFLLNPHSKKSVRKECKIKFRKDEAVNKNTNLNQNSEKYWLKKKIKKPFDVQ